MDDFGSGKRPLSARGQSLIASITVDVYGTDLLINDMMYAFSEIILQFTVSVVSVLRADFLKVALQRSSMEYQIR